MAPTAGTDHPCGPALPGAERFYTQLNGPLTPNAWLESVRLGRTFVTDGPMVEFHVNGQGIGIGCITTRSGTGS